MPITKSQAEHCNGLRGDKVHQAWDTTTARGVQEESRGASCKNAIFANKLLLWQMNLKRDGKMMLLRESKRQSDHACMI